MKYRHVLRPAGNPLISLLAAMMINGAITYALQDGATHINRATARGEVAVDSIGGIQIVEDTGTILRSRATLRDTRMVLERGRVLVRGHDGGRDTIMYAGPAILEDVGTTYMVSHPDANTTILCVLDGAVRVSTPDHGGQTERTVVYRGTRATIRKTDHGIEIREERVGLEKLQEAAAWVDGHVIGDDERFGQFVDDVQNYTDDIIVLDPNLRDRKMELLDFPITEPGSVRDKLERILRLAAPDLQIEERHGSGSTLVISSQSGAADNN